LAWDGLNCRMRTGRGVWWILLAFVVVMVVLVGRGGAGGSAPIPPAFAAGTTLAQAEEAAVAGGKPVLVFATADWCGPCQSFKRGALVDPAVAERIGAGFVPVYVDVDRAATEAQRLKVGSIPVLIVLRSGKEVARLEGGANAERVVAWLEQAAK